MVPVFDLLNHHAEHVANTKTFHEGGSLRVALTKDVPEGGQLFFSYHSGRNAMELFRDYGFVEDFPVRWALATSRHQVEYLINSTEGPLVWDHEPTELNVIEEHIDAAAALITTLKARLEEAKEYKGTPSPTRK